MKFYIASKLENFEQVQDLSNLLKSFGWEHTYDWTKHGSVKESNVETLKRIGQQEFDGVNNADIVIVLTPQGRGTHVELGMAIAMNKIVYICHKDDTYFKCDDNTSAFYWLSNVRHFIGSVEKLAKKLQSQFNGFETELWDIYDINGKLTGKTMTRGDIFADGEYHLGVAAWIVNDKNELLLQKRAATKRIFPNLWATTGGAVLAGETSKEGCIREVKEELGIELNENDLVLLNRSFRKGLISDDYIVTIDISLNNLTIQSEEISEVKWATIDEIKRLVETGQFLIDDINDIQYLFDYFHK
jgi:isopentenyldiphosphate isomerase